MHKWPFYFGKIGGPLPQVAWQYLRKIPLSYSRKRPEVDLISLLQTVLNKVLKIQWMSEIRNSLDFRQLLSGASSDALRETVVFKTTFCFMYIMLLLVQILVHGLEKILSRFWQFPDFQRLVLEKLDHYDSLIRSSSWTSNGR